MPFLMVRKMGKENWKMMEHMIQNLSHMLYGIFA